LKKPEVIGKAILRLLHRLYVAPAHVDFIAKVEVKD
jgi:hypothetical protein